MPDEPREVFFALPLGRLVPAGEPRKFKGKGISSLST